MGKSKQEQGSETPPATSILEQVGWNSARLEHSAVAPPAPTAPARPSARPLWLCAGLGVVLLAYSAGLAGTKSYLRGQVEQGWQALQQLGKPGPSPETHAAARRFLADFPGSSLVPNHRAGEAIELLEASGSARLRVLALDAAGLPCAGKLQLDSAPVGTTPWDGRVGAGEHRVFLECASASSPTRVVTLVQGEERSLTLQTTNAPPLSLPSGWNTAVVELTPPWQVQASSEAKGDAPHPARDAVDGEMTTAWNEGSPGPGDGEWLALRFRAPARIRRVRFSTGWDGVSDKGEDFHVLNSHLRRVRLVFDQGPPIEREIGYGVRSVELDGLDRVSSTVRLEALQVWPGWRWPDLCISEVKVFGSTAIGPKRPKPRLVADAPGAPSAPARAPQPVALPSFEEASKGWNQ